MGLWFLISLIIIYYIFKVNANNKKIFLVISLIIYITISFTLNKNVRLASTHGNTKHGWYSKYNSSEKLIAVSWFVIFPIGIIFLYDKLFISTRQINKEYHEKIKKTNNKNKINSDIMNRVCHDCGYITLKQEFKEKNSDLIDLKRTYRTKLTGLPLIILIGGLSLGFVKLYSFMNNPQAILGFIIGSIVITAVFYMMFTKTITPAKEYIPKSHNTDDLKEALNKYFSIADSIISTKTTDMINKVVYYSGVIEAFSEFNHVKTKDFLYKFFEKHFKLSSKEVDKYINKNQSSKYRVIYEKGYDDFRNYVIDDEFELQTKI